MVDDPRLDPRLPVFCDAMLLGLLAPCSRDPEIEAAGFEYVGPLPRSAGGNTGREWRLKER